MTLRPHARGALIFLALLLAACAPKKAPSTSGDVAGAVTRQPPVAPTTVAEADDAYLRRHVREETERAIALYEAALAQDPARADGAAIRTRLSILYYGKAYYFDAEAPKAERMATYLLGRDHGLEALRSNPTFAAARDEGTSLKDAIPLLGEEDVGPLYWSALNWSRWGEMKGILRVALDIPKVRAAMERCNTLAEDYYEAAAHRFFSAFFAALPPFAGQDIDLAEAHARRAREIAPRHTENQITEADYLATFHRDRARYLALLQEVLDQPLPPESDPFYFELLVARWDAERKRADVDRVLPE
jgi:hypothetical protein